MDLQQDCIDVSEPAVQLASNILPLALLPLQEVLAEAAAARSLRARVAELEAYVELKEKQLEACEQDQQGVIASILCSLELEQKKRGSAEKELHRSIDSALAPSATHNQFFGPARFLDARDLLALGATYSTLHKLAQEDGLWRALSHRQASLSSWQNCTNYRSALLSRNAGIRLKSRELELAQLSERTERLSGYLTGQSNTGVYWTLSQQSLRSTQQGSAIQSPPFVVRGRHGHFTFYPKGDRNHSRCAFYIHISCSRSRSLDMSANVFIGGQSCQTLSKFWGKNAKKVPWGFPDAGPAYGSHSTDLQIQVSFKILEETDCPQFCEIQS